MVKNATQLRESAAHQRDKAEGFRRLAETTRQKSEDYKDDPAMLQRYLTEAQDYEEKASRLNREALEMETEAADYEAKALEIERQKQQIQIDAQARVDQLEQQEKSLRGDL